MAVKVHTGTGSDLQTFVAVQDRLRKEDRVAGCVQVGKCRKCGKPILLTTHSDAFHDAQVMHELGKSSLLQHERVCLGIDADVDEYYLIIQDYARMSAGPAWETFPNS
ncbi:MAG: hypothetical protein COT39_01700 [Parcubacteria group bacterium CG08_land_8_20_14_0_20_48_21]|nr:MAG: hypothetical protein AUK21_02620 [Parcubacteria group bacterium CG2_30_48_51]PIS32957.1 MAG: hypothetical protein COT39_01700 [Parcubacteria group bacterium CG08_land_8_20_14_0_20_48_21]PIW78880.1 MAG: hypothetical protein COZ99_03960 [Parcubacteria group bacterium CG_4_8_14_3_um_filter_48_16]PIY77924.1 MAG: hypothetical protein COY83_02620 [Parcubacteria group bacterium CG_4_10_14_0_8_um_filter_48_154]PIZ78608.1 MAG: hypothetical protein COY03_00025 [bacterium CG_4_10_14_0_2_um_filter_